jgi:hypothetical protein
MKCPNCDAEIPLRGPYRNIPVCECCGEEGAGCLYRMDLRLSLCLPCERRQRREVLRNDGGSATYRLTEFGIDMPGCRVTVRPCAAADPGAERVLRSESGLLLTERHELRNLFILPVDSEFVIVTVIQ